MAEDYIRNNSVQNLIIEKNQVMAKVIGIENCHVDIRLRGNEVSSMKCSCPYAKVGSRCKHMAAVMLVWENCMKAESDAKPATPTVSLVEDPALSEKEKQPVINTAENYLQLTINIDDVLTRLSIMAHISSGIFV